MIKLQLILCGQRSKRYRFVSQIERNIFKIIMNRFSFTFLHNKPPNSTLNFVTIRFSITFLHKAVKFHFKLYFWNLNLKIYKNFEFTNSFKFHKTTSKTNAQKKITYNANKTTRKPQFKQNAREGGRKTSMQGHSNIQIHRLIQKESQNWRPVGPNVP